SRNEGASGQQFARNQTRVWIKQRIVTIRHGFRQRDVSAETSPGHSHARVLETVERAVSGSPTFLAGAPPGGRSNTVTRVKKIVLAQPVSKDREINRRN